MTYLLIHLYTYTTYTITYTNFIHAETALAHSFTQCVLAAMRVLGVSGFGIILKDGDRGSGGKSERTKTIRAGLDCCSHKGTQAHLLHQLLRDTASSSSLFYFHLWSLIHTLAFSSFFPTLFHSLFTSHNFQAL